MAIRSHFLLRNTFLLPLPLRNFVYRCTPLEEQFCVQFLGRAAEIRTSSLRCRHRRRLSPSTEHSCASSTLISALVISGIRLNFLSSGCLSAAGVHRIHDDLHVRGARQDEHCAVVAGALRHLLHLHHGHRDHQRGAVTFTCFPLPRLQCLVTWETISQKNGVDENTAR